MAQAAWPVHRRGRMWSFTFVRVANGYAFIPLEVAASRLLGGAAAFTVALLLAWAADALGILPDIGAWTRILVALGSALVGDQLGRREAARRMQRILREPDRHLRRAGAFVLPEGTRIVQTRRRRRVGRVEVEWWDPAEGTRRASLTMPAGTLDAFNLVWASKRPGGGR